MLVVRLTLPRAVGDQQEKPKEGGRQNSDEDKRDPKEDPPDRLQGVATGLSLRRLHVDHEARGIGELECADAGCLR